MPASSNASWKSLNEEKRKIESELAALEVKKLATSDGIQLYYVYDVRPMR